MLSEAGLSGRRKGLLVMHTKPSELVYPTSDLLFTGAFNIVDDAKRMFVLWFLTNSVQTLFGRISVQLFTRAINRVFSIFFFSPPYWCLALFYSPVPDGKPTVTSAHNSSSTSIYLNWKPPPKSSIHGEFLGYRLAYKQRDDTGSDSVQEIFLRDPSIEVFLFFEIRLFAEYISLTVFWFF